MSGKTARRKRGEGEDRKALAREKRIAEDKVRHLRAVEEAKKAGVLGEHIDLQIIIDGMSDAERSTMKGAAAPSIHLFQRLIEKKLARMVQIAGRDQFMPTKLGLAIADVLHGRLKVEDNLIEVVGDGPRN